MPTSVILVLASFALLTSAWYWRQHRHFHITAMSTLILFDLLFPIYLYMTHDWIHRLIEQGELFSFLIWSHLILVLLLYALYILQISAGRAMVKGAGDREKQQELHRKQFYAILTVRLLIFSSGLLLIN